MVKIKKTDGIIKVIVKYIIIKIQHRIMMRVGQFKVWYTDMRLGIPSKAKQIRESLKHQKEVSKNESINKSAK